jgi:hypothetical protein
MDAFHDRLDALGPDAPHLRSLGAVHLDRSLDPELQAIVEEAAAALKAPIALVSLVLDRVQFFRAHVGLDPDLATSRATDRDVSFCQLVVRDRSPLEVSDASADPRVPQELVRELGLRAYLGAPVRSDDAVIGSLCILDVEPRSFDAQDLTTLERMARRVEARFEALEQERARARLDRLERSMTPVFPEVRNLLTPLRANLGSARLALADLAPLVAMAGRVAESEQGARFRELTQAAGAYDDLADIVEDLQAASDRLSRSLMGLEAVVLPHDRPIDLPDALDLARGLAEHRLRLLPALHWSRPPSEGLLVTDRGSAVSLLASVLSALASLTLAVGAGSLGLEPIDAGPQHQAVLIEVPGCEGTRMEDVVGGLVRLTRADPQAQVEPVAQGVVVRFRVAPAPPA